jgi:hypothetical protein
MTTVCLSDLLLGSSSRAMPLQARAGRERSLLHVSVLRPTIAIARSR